MGPNRSCKLRETSRRLVETKCKTETTNLQALIRWKRKRQRSRGIRSLDSSQDLGPMLRPNDFMHAFTLPPQSTATAQRRTSPLQLLPVAFLLLLACSTPQNGLPQLTSADVIEQTFGQQLPDPAALVFAMHEFGSGDGYSSSQSRASLAASSSLSSSSSSSKPADLSPALIEARCWNNYENDNDCKQLNVITAPEGTAAAASGEQAHGAGEDEDNIITPVVIFESASVADAADEEGRQNGGNELSSQGASGEQRPLVFMAPPYQAGVQDPSRTLHKQQETQQRPTAISSTMRGSGGAEPVTRPSVFHFVATPQPTKAPARQPPMASTQFKNSITKNRPTGRRCRDDEDADCDEPEEAKSQMGETTGQRAKAPGNSAKDEEADPEDGDNDENDDDGKAAHPQTGTASQSNLISELGSGGGGGSSASDDDTDDSTDDADDSDDSAATNAGPNGDSGESSGSSIMESTPNEVAGEVDDNRLLVVTTIRPKDAANQNSQTGSAKGVEVQTARRRPPLLSGGAEIEVVVHSTLPPSFPQRPTPNSPVESASFDSSATSTTSTSATTMPDDTFRSRPIFPSTSSSVSSEPSNRLNETLDNQNGANSEQPTTEDLFTFKPIPIPVEQPPILPPEGRQARIEPMQVETSEGTGTGTSNLATQSKDEVKNSQPNGGDVTKSISSEHIHDLAGHRRVSHEKSPSLPTFDDGWTTRRPTAIYGNSFNQQPQQQQQQQVQLSDVLMAANGAAGKRNPAKGHGHMNTDILPTMLNYASFIVLVFVSFAVLFAAYIFWHRNSLRRRALLAKAQFLNGAGMPPGMMPSMSHASHLMHGGTLQPGQQPPPGPPPPGLLSTYAQGGKGLSAGKVTTSLVKSVDQDGNLLLGSDVGLADGQDAQQGKDDSGDQLTGAGDELEDGVGSSISDNNSHHQQQQRRLQMQHQHRLEHAPHLANQTGKNQSGSWSTSDEPTTTSSGSQPSQDSQLQQHQQPSGQIANGGSSGSGLAPSAPRHHYPNSLSDGRQNSSSISDSQCSPDSQQAPQAGSSSLGGQPLQMSATQPHHLQRHMGQPPPPIQSGQQVPQHDVMGPRAPTQRLMSGPQQRPPFQLNRNATLPIGPAHSQPIMPPPVHIRQPFYPMMMMQNGVGSGFKQRLMASRSIENIQPASEHVNFIANNNNQQHVPYSPLHHQQPLLVQAGPQRPYQQHVTVTAGMGSPLAQQSNMVMMSPQRIAMNPLATLSRRYPPGTGLNRNIYSEDSSSFMTTSPSLARTSSSSSFAFNMSNLPTPSSIKAKPFVDGSGRVMNDYSIATNLTDHAGSNGRNSAAPPVLGRSDRSEAWYV